MTKAIFVAVLLSMIVITTGYCEANSDAVSLNGDWKFKLVPWVDDKTPPADTPFYEGGFDDSSWDDIDVPGNWELNGFGEAKYTTPNPAYGLYRKKISVPPEWRKQHVFVRFEGVAFGYDLWFNGEKIGSWESAFNPCEFDISKYAKAGDGNVIAVRVTTRPTPWEFDTNDDWGLCGIYRDVTLFPVPELHLKDITVVTRVARDRKSATLDISAEAELFSEGMKMLHGVELTGRLRDPNGKLVKKFSAAETTKGGDAIRKLRYTIDIQDPYLWTAETPQLYTLELSAGRGGENVHTRELKIGVREISIENGVLMVNHLPIKLRGVNRHESDPKVGKALREKHWLEDIRLMKSANVNFVRTSHYPPHERFIELCDEYGIYVNCEVPFGYGNDHLTDPAFQEPLYTRAEATVKRDKNHASVIIWSCGNENPWTPLVENVVKRVKELDPTRPACVPMTNAKFIEVGFQLLECVDIYAPHYPSPEQINEWAAAAKKPLLATEYSHSLGTSTELLSACWNTMLKHDNWAGGAIWHWRDQGVYKKAAAETPGLHSDVVWPSTDTYIDCNGAKGTDGIIYADGVLQTDYYQTRKVYSPVVVKQRELNIPSESKAIILAIENRYDFVDLSEKGIKCSWEIYEDAKRTAEGSQSLSLAARSSGKLEIAASLPDDLSGKDCRLILVFKDKDNNIVYDCVVRLFPENGKPNIAERFASNKGSGGERVKDIIKGPFLVRTGRFPSLAERATLERYPDAAYWMPYLISSDDGVNYPRPGMDGQSITANIKTTESGDGSVGVDYTLTPKNATGIFLELGLSFTLPADISEVRWLGQGPYSVYPGKTELSEHGIWRLSADDLYYPGNRSGVEMAAFTDKNGRGVGIICDSADIAWERAEDGIIISHNAMIAGRGNKRVRSKTEIQASGVDKTGGSFCIVPLSANHWPKIFADIFGPPKPADYPIFKPYQASYDQ